MALVSDSKHIKTSHSRLIQNPFNLSKVQLALKCDTRWTWKCPNKEGVTFYVGKPEEKRREEKRIFIYRYLEKNQSLSSIEEIWVSRFSKPRSQRTISSLGMYGFPTWQCWAPCSFSVATRTDKERAAVRPLICK